LKRGVNAIYLLDAQDRGEIPGRGVFRGPPDLAWVLTPSRKVMICGFKKNGYFSARLWK
jgi:hypothetical protein